MEHSVATRIEIELTYEPELICLRVQDDGCGFVPKADADGFGLIGMHQRADQINSQLTIVTQPGRGTSIFVRTPLKRADIPHYLCVLATMSQPKIRVLVADDHPVVRNGLMLMVNYEPGMEAVAEAKDGMEAVQLFHQHQPDVTLMDLRMPEMSGVDAIISIRRAFPNACLIILTTYDSDEDIYQGLKAGARGYILKDAPLNEIKKAIRDVHAGKKYIPPAVGAKLTEQLSASQLSDRECDVLRQIARGKSNRAIAEILGISEGTVKTHVNHILSKLEASDQTHAIIIALKRGIISL